MKRIVFAMLAFIMCLGFVACGNKEIAAKKPLTEIYSDILAAAELPEMLSLDGDTLNIYVGIGSNLYTEHIAAIPVSATSGNMLFVFEATDKANATVIKGLLKNFLDQKASEMKDYIPAEYEILNAASVTVKDRYVWLVVSNNESEILEIINDNIK